MLKNLVINMVLALPIEFLERGELKRVVFEAREVAYSVGKKYIKAPELIDRPANPKDFGLNANTFEFGFTPDTEGKATIVDRVLDDDEVIAIYGLANLSTNPTITRIVFETGSERLADIDFEQVYAHNVPEVVLDKPIVYSPKSRMRIVIYSTATAGEKTAEKLVLNAVVVEKAGKNVSKPL